MLQEENYSFLTKLLIIAKPDKVNFQADEFTNLG
jgi:hypothetical protein